MNMKKFNDYYQELYNNTPEKFSKFGHFGREVYHDMVMEGLITSYPQDKVLKFLENLNGLNPMTPNISPFIEGANIMFHIKHSHSVPITQTVEELNRKLAVFGYFVGKTGSRNWADSYSITVEPKYPTPISEEEKMDSPFYHITHRKYLPKIKKIGLTPRDSTTLFSHPGGRVYILQVEDSYILQELGYMLSVSKEASALKKGKNPESFSEDNLVYLQIEVPKDMVLYKDPMFDPDQKDVNAVFTTQNIPPQYIKQVSI